MSTFDIKKSCTFDDITFPVMECQIVGNIRRHTHVFPYSPGGPTEKMARDNYKIKIKATLCDSYPDYGESLYPTALGELRKRFEAQLTAPLNVPNLGVVRAYIYSWIQTMSSKVQNGEDVEIVFEEDTTDLFSVDTILTNKSNGFLSSKDKFALEVDKLKGNNIFGFAIDIFDKILEVADLVQSAIDQVQLFDSLIASKIDALTGLLERAADDVDLIKDPTNITTIEAFKEFWFSAIDLQETINGTGLLRPYEVQKDSTLSEVCISIYGDTNRASEILALNFIEDPFLIPAGTILIYSE